MNKIKAELVKWKGGKCLRCGIKYGGTNACIFQFHHNNPNEKDNQVKPFSWTLEKCKREAHKCDMLCANCHFIIHSGRY